MTQTSKRPRFRRRILLAAGLLVLAAAVAWLGFWPWFITHRVERTLTYTLTSDSPEVTLYFPYNSAPRLLGYQLRNLDVAAMRLPRLLNNGQPRLWTVDEVMQAIGGTQQPPDVLVLNIVRFLQHHLRHAVDKDICEGAPVDDLLQAINFVGLAQCGQFSSFICQLAERAGLPAHRIMLDKENPRGHVVAEVYWGGQWHMIDADRDFIFPSADYRQLLSFAEVRRQPALLRRLPFESANRYVLAQQKVLLTGQATPMHTPPLTTQLASQATDLPPDGELSFDTGYRRALRGCAVTFRATERPRGGEEWIINPPYPVLRLHLSSGVRLPLQDPATQKSYIAGPGSPVTLDYTGATRPWLVPLADRRVFLSNPDLAGQPIDLVADMHCARNALPTIGEGANRLAIDSASPQWKVRVTLRVSLLEVR